MPLTPEQFNKLVTREILKEDLKELEEKIYTKIDKKIDQVLTAVDGIAKKHKDFETELAANQGAHDRFDEKFTKTNGRMEILEKKLGVSRVEV